jgi:hypothetical protein
VRLGLSQDAEGFQSRNEADRSAAGFWKAYRACHASSLATIHDTQVKTFILERIPYTKANSRVSTASRAKMLHSKQRCSKKGDLRWMFGGPCRCHTPVRRSATHAPSGRVFDGRFCGTTSEKWGRFQTVDSPVTGITSTVWGLASDELCT